MNALRHRRSAGTIASVRGFTTSVVGVTKSSEPKMPRAETEGTKMEHVLVVPRSKLMPSCYPQGCFFDYPKAAAYLQTIERDGFFIERAHAEKTPKLKQPIPYCVVQTEDGRILCVQRSNKQGEQRLHGKLSVGLGGHVNPGDKPSTQVSPVEPDHPKNGEAETSPIWQCVRRELQEELAITGTVSLRLRGFLNYDSDPVGAVHFGLVMVASVEGSVSIRETDQMKGEFKPVEEVLGALESSAQGEAMKGFVGTGAPNSLQFEPWSAHLLQTKEILDPTLLSQAAVDRRYSSG